MNDTTKAITKDVIIHLLKQCSEKQRTAFFKTFLNGKHGTFEEVANKIPVDDYPFIHDQLQKRVDKNALLQSRKIPY